MAGGKRIISSSGKFLFTSGGKMDICEDCCGTECTAIGTCNCCTTCGIGSSDNTTHPRLKVTICWTNPNLSSVFFLGCSNWQNGESRIVCPYEYVSATASNAPTTETDVGWHESWVGGSFGVIELRNGAVWNYFGRLDENEITITEGSLTHNGLGWLLHARVFGSTGSQFTQFNTLSLSGTTTTSSGAVIVGDFTPTSAYQLGLLDTDGIQNGQMGFVTEVNSGKGFTISWEAVTGEGQSWDNWRREDTGSDPLIPSDPCINGCCAGVPSMLITITGNEPAGTNETITWCGETWTPAQAGEQRAVCPTKYAKSLGSNTWMKNTGDTTTAALSLSLARRFDSGILEANYIKLADGTAITAVTDWRTTDTTAETFEIGVLTSSSAVPTASDFTINDNQFGSYETGGVTYAWSKGDNWP